MGADGGGGEGGPEGARARKESEAAAHAGHRRGGRGCAVGWRWDGGTGAARALQQLGLV